MAGDKALDIYEDLSERSIYLSEYTEDSLRTFVGRLLDRYVPSKVGDPTFEEITQGRSLSAKRSKSFFSTCGELAMFTLERIGYRGQILNRTLTEEKHGIRRSYRFGMNMHYLYGRAQSEGCFVRMKEGMVPNLGDICFISNGPSTTEHVFVFSHAESDNEWESWDAGQGSRMEQEAKVCLRKVIGNRVGGRVCYGWVNIAGLNLEAPADLHVPG